MSTRSSVSVVLEGGSVKTIYCHWDGYPEGVGKELKENYNTFEQAVELVNHGDASEINKSIELCVFYHRDRKENLNFNKYNSVQVMKFELENDYGDSEYDYLFQDGKWFCRNRHKDFPTFMEY